MVRSEQCLWFENPIYRSSDHACGVAHVQAKGPAVDAMKLWP